MEKEPWENFVKDWELIPLEGYKFLFQRATDRFEETITECESITDKSIKLLGAIIITIPYFIAYNFCHLPICASLFFLCIYLSNVGILLKILFPRPMDLRGSQPKEIYTTCIEPPQNVNFEKDERITIIYRQELIRIQESIDHNRNVNKGRILLFKWALRIAAFIFMIGLTFRFICLPL